MPAKFPELYNNVVIQNRFYNILNRSIDKNVPKMFSLTRVILCVIILTCWSNFLRSIREFIVGYVTSSIALRHRVPEIARGKKVYYCRVFRIPTAAAPWPDRRTILFRVRILVFDQRLPGTTLIDVDSVFPVFTRSYRFEVVNDQSINQSIVIGENRRTDWRGVRSSRVYYPYCTNLTKTPPDNTGIERKKNGIKAKINP